MNVRVKRLGLIGDVHTEHGALEEVLAFFQREQITDIVCTGDVVNGFGDAERCCQLLREFKVRTVRGNHDRWLMAWGEVSLPNATRIEALSEESMNWLQSLPETLEIETTGGLALLCHGIGNDDMELITEEESDEVLLANCLLQDLVAQQRFRFLINGHSHRHMVRHVPSALSGSAGYQPLTIINAGTLRRDHHPLSGIADFSAGTLRFIGLDFEGRPVAVERAICLDPV